MDKPQKDKTAESYLTGLDFFFHRLFRQCRPEDIKQDKVNTYGTNVFGEKDALPMAIHMIYHRRCIDCGELSSKKIQIF